jgi:hypothetical protein
MPVKSGIFQWHRMDLMDVTSQDEDEHQGEEENTRKHMEPVKAGHRIVEAIEEDLSFFPFEERGGVGIDSMVKLRCPLRVFIEEKEKS